MLRMRDISNWQGEPDIARVFPDAHIIASKATEGAGYTSPAFHDADHEKQGQWYRAKAAGKARMAYHYFHPSVQVLAQVRHFLDTVKNAGLQSGDMLAMDLEDSDGLRPDQVAAAAAEFLHGVNQETKAHCIVYTYINFAGAGNCAGLGKHPLWIADPSSPPGKPRVPHPWTEWDFHQYGIVRGIDIDIANFGSLEAMLGLGALTEAPEPGPDVRTLWLSDGKQEIERDVNVHNLVPGFKLKVGEASFHILEN